MDFIYAMKVARDDLCLAIRFNNADGGVCDEWHWRFEQSIRLLTDQIGDHQEFSKILIECGMNPEILIKSFC